MKRDDKLYEILHTGSKAVSKNKNNLFYQALKCRIHKQGKLFLHLGQLLDFQSFFVIIATCKTFFIEYRFTIDMSQKKIKKGNTKVI